MNTKGMIKVMQASMGGKNIECKCRWNNKWYELNQPSWNWFDCKYRVKQEPITQWYVVDDNDNIHYQFDDKKRAEYIASTTNNYRVVKMQEVKEE